MSAFHDFSGFVKPKDGKEIDVIDLFYWNDVEWEEKPDRPGIIAFTYAHYARGDFPYVLGSDLAPLIDAGKMRGTSDNDIWGFTFNPDMQQFVRNEVFTCDYVVGMDDPDTVAASLPNEVVRAVMNRLGEEQQLDKTEKTENKQGWTIQM